MPEANPHVIHGRPGSRPRRWVRGTPIPISAYDQFVLWHFLAMNTLTPDDPVLSPRDRNAARRGSIFLPWHRFMLRLFELHLQRVLQGRT